MEKMERRIESLEKQLRFFKRITGLVIVLVASVFLIGAVTPAPKTVTADKVLIEDSKGKERLYIGMNDYDEPVITFFSPDGNPLYTIGSTGPAQAAPPPERSQAWAWPEKKSARLWDLTIWFQRPKKGETQKFHNRPGCSHLQSAVRAGDVDGKKVTKQKLDYAFKHFADQLEPCACCISLFPAD